MDHSSAFTSRALRLAEEEKALNAIRSTTATANSSSGSSGSKNDEKLPPLRVAISGPGVGWQQPSEAPDRTPSSKPPSQAPGTPTQSPPSPERALSPESYAATQRVRDAADALATKVAAGSMGGKVARAVASGETGERGGGSASGGGSSGGGGGTNNSSVSGS